jgi:hypothetical protein
MNDDNTNVILSMMNIVGSKYGIETQGRFLAALSVPIEVKSNPSELVSLNFSDIEKKEPLEQVRDIIKFVRVKLEQLPDTLEIREWLGECTSVDSFISDFEKGWLPLIAGVLFNE